MAILTLKIKGIALIKMDREWRIYLPWNTCHKVTFKSPRHGINVDLNTPGQHIRIEASVGSGSIPEPVADATFDQVLDITGPDVHSEGVDLKRNWNDCTALLTVPFGRYSATISPHTYSLERNGEIIKALGMIGVDGRIDLEAIDFVIHANTSGGEFPLRISQDAEVEIDNDCFNLQNNDFRMFYDFTFDDRASPPNVFAVVPDLDSAALPCNNFRASRLLESK